MNKRRFIHSGRRSGITGLIFILVMGCHFLSAAVFEVPGTYPTITAAIAAAGAGDTVRVAPGTYEEGFYIPRNLWFICPGPGRAVVRFDGTYQTIASWAGSNCMITSGYGVVPRFRNFEFDGIDSAGTDTCRNLIYMPSNAYFYGCVLHGAKGYLYRSNENGNADSCEFYGPANEAWRVKTRGTVSNSRFHHLNTALYNYHTNGAFFLNNVIYECITAVFSRDGRDNTYANNLMYHCRNGYYAVYFDSFDPSLRPYFINNTIVLNERHGIRISGIHNSTFKNNILYWNGLADTSVYYDVYVRYGGKESWDITYNDIWRHSDSLDATLADTTFAVGNISADPLFADTSVGDSLNGFYLRVHSPCIDAGNQGVRDPDGSPSDMGCYGGPEGRMKAPEWIRNIGGVTHTDNGDGTDAVSWTQYDVPGNFASYAVYHDTTTTDMHYQPGPGVLVDSVTSIATTSGTYPHKDDTWYRISVVGDSTGYPLGGGFTEMDTVFPQLLAAYYYCNGTSDPSDDELRLLFNEGIYESGIDLSDPGRYLNITGVGGWGDAVISTVNEFVVSMGATSTMFAHNRTWVSVRPDSLEDFYGNAVQGSVLVTTFNVVNKDNNNAFESISQAVQQASAGQFLTVYDDGYYPEQVSVNKSRLVVQADTTADPVVDADGNPYCFVVSADEVRIVGFRCDSAGVAGIYFGPGLDGGYAVLDTFVACTRGVWAQSDTGIVIRRNVFRNGGASHGIYLTGTVDALVTGNISYGNGGDGINAFNSSGTEIRNNVFYGNAGDGIETSAGGGIISNTVCFANGTADINNAAGYTTANNRVTADGDPAFTDTTARDFTLQQASPLWGTGQNGDNIGRWEGRVYVQGSGTRYHEIKSAYAAAAAGDTLTVCPGHYYEKIIAGKAVAVIADSGSGHNLVHDEYAYRSGVHYLVYQSGTADPLYLQGFNIDGENANVMYDGGGWGSNEYYGVNIDMGAVKACTLMNFSKAVSNYAAFSLTATTTGRVLVDSCRFVNCGYAALGGSGRNTVSYCSFDSTALGVQLQGDNDTVRNCYFRDDNSLRLSDDCDRNVICNNIFYYADINYDGVDFGGGDDPQYNRWANNVVFHDEDGMQIPGNSDTLVNNIIAGNEGGSYALDIRDANQALVTGYYNDITSTDATGLTAANWNMMGGAFEPPLFSDTTSPDFHLLIHSPMIDRGDLRVMDPDGGRSDIGAYGGPLADTLAPARLDTLLIFSGVTDDSLYWCWNGNAPADFKYYMVYRDTAGPNFIPSTLNAVDSISSLGSAGISLSHNSKTWFYKVSAGDTDGYGGGYALFDTVPPIVDTALYFSNATPTLADDTIKIILSEWIIDMTLPGPFSSYFRMSGLGNVDNGIVSSGIRVNDDTLIVTNIDTILCRKRSWLGFADSTALDYVYNLNKTDSIGVVTYNVGIPRTGEDYQTIGEAAAAAVAGDSILVIDAGFYEEKVSLTSDLALVGYGIDYGGGWITGDSLPVVMNPASVGTLLYVADACTVTGIRFVTNPAVDGDIAMVTQVNVNPHYYARCVFVGNDTARYCWNEPSGGDFTVDSCDFSGFRQFVLYSRIKDQRQTVTNNRFHDMRPTKSSWGDAAILLYPGGMHTTSQYFSNNMFYDIAGGGAIAMRQAQYVNITGNLVYKCRYGFNWSISSSNNARNYFAFNTVVACTGAAISSKTLAGQEDTVKYNLCLNNGQDLTHYVSSAQPVADYNWFTGYNNGNWTVGAHSDSGNPLFVDEAGNDYRLMPTSLCLDFTDMTDAMASVKGLTPYDLDCYPRSDPPGSYWDVGCFEGLLGPPRVDSVKSWCSGTDTVGDDSLVVWFRRPVEFDSLPLGAGEASHAFGVLGPGDIGYATLDTPVGCPDTNFIFIRMNAGDTILSHLRSRLTLNADSVFSCDAVPATADTDSVSTFNVYNLRTDSGYATIEAALLASVDNDTVMVFDQGYYTDTLNFCGLGTARNGVSAFLIGAEGMYPVIKNDGTGQTGHPAWQGSDMMIYNDNEDVEIRGFCFDGVNLSQDDTSATFLWFDRGTVAGCSLYYANAKFDDGSTCAFTGNVVCGKGMNWWTEDGGSVTGNRFYDCSSGNALYLYGSENTTVGRNVFHDNTSPMVITLRDARNNVLYNNLIYRNSGTACRSSNEMCENNAYTSNTFVNNVGGGLEVDSASAVRNNIFFGNTGYNISLRATAATHTDSITYNYFDTTGAGMGDSLTGEGNVISTSYPLFSDSAAGDFHLRVHAPCIDRGDTAAASADFDGSRCDMGAYGGLWQIDTLMPHRTDTLIVTGDPQNGYTADSLRWESYNLADFRFFAVYRDTFTDFIPSAATCIGSIFTAATTGTTFTNGGKEYMYKVSVVDDTSYGGGYRTGGYARIHITKVSDRAMTIPGDTITYTVYYDNDAEIASVDTFRVIDRLPSNVVLIDTLSTTLHTGGSMAMEWYDGTVWATAKPAPSSVQGMKWKFAPGIAAQSGAGDTDGADLTKTGMDTTGGTDAGYVKFRVVVE